VMRRTIIVIGLWGAMGLQTLAYEEESFGTLKPDAPAKPAATDVYQRREAPPDDVPSVESERRGSSGQQGTPPQRPKYRDVYEQASRGQRGYGDEESIGLSLGVGFGFKAFSGSLGLTFPINRFVAWGVGGFYAAYETDKNAQEKSGGDVSFIVRIPNPTPLTPFVSAGPGYETWDRSADDGNGLESFDADDSPTANWSVGSTVRLARYVSLLGALKSTTYTERPPRSFDGDHRMRDPRTNERFEFGFVFGF
jgi:hypothetical protein